MPTDRILILGSNGQLGTDLVRAFSGDAVGLTHAELDVTSPTAVAATLQHLSPTLVLNTAAFHPAARCEQDPDHAFRVNAIGAMNVAKNCALIDALVVHFSTDYVFDGTKGTPYTEEDPVSPLSVYGLSKSAGERAVAAYCPRYYVVRTSGLYGRTPSRAKGDNFITKVRRLAREQGHVSVVEDEFASPTWTASLARQVRMLCDEQRVRYGVVHAVNAGQCSWYEFAREIVRLTGETARVEPVRRGTEPASGVRRPGYSALRNQALMDAGSDIMESWEDALAAYINEVDA